MEIKWKRKEEEREGIERRRKNGKVGKREKEGKEGSNVMYV